VGTKRGWKLGWRHGAAFIINQMNECVLVVSLTHRPFYPCCGHNAEDSDACHSQQPWFMNVYENISGRFWKRFNYCFLIPISVILRWDIPFVLIRSQLWQKYSQNTI
jgi:hypothetical protein